MNLFFTEAIANGYALLTEAESKHVIQVLRMQVGETIHFVDGKGGYYEGIIQDPHPKKCLLKIEKEEQAFGKRPYSLHLAVAPTKNIDRFEWVLEKATEFGVDRITPILCDRSERKVIKWERSNRVIVSAMKQSLKAYMPILDEITPFKKLINQELIGDKLIAHCDNTPKTELNIIVKPKQKYIVLIGPEGDFSPSEISHAEANNYKSISLGASRLRTETAAISACNSIYYINS